MDVICLPCLIFFSYQQTALQIAFQAQCPSDCRQIVLRNLARILVLVSHALLKNLMTHYCSNRSEEQVGFPKTQAVVEHISFFGNGSLQCDNSLLPGLVQLYIKHAFMALLLLWS